MENRQTAETVPGWDGDPRGWRRYQREVSWFVMGTKPSMRKYLAPRLIAKLTGPARLLAMGWSQQDFQGVDAVNQYLKKLSKSPLVRRKLPNTAAVMQQYFGFRREQMETIPHFLVRESLHFEEFVEALHLLKQEKDGAMDEVFIPPMDEEESDEDDDGETQSPTPKKKSDYKPVPADDPDDQTPAPAAGGGRPTSSTSPTSSMDSFILEQLRGWRLLMAAALSPEEWRSILASTGNRLNYVSVMSALEILYDEHFSRGRGQHGFGGAQGHQPSTHYFNMAENEGWEDDDESWSTWWMAPVNEEDDNMEDYGNAPPAAAEPPAEEGEAMMADASKRSWSQAQRATQVMKKDRGFGTASASGSGAAGQQGCFICGSHQHLARQCPDRNAPFRFGKGKSVHWGEMGYGSDYYDDGSYVMVLPAYKGKKGKGKGKSAYWMPDDGTAYTFTGKGFGKGKHSKNRQKVNAYAMDAYDYNGIEFEAQAAQQVPPDQLKNPVIQPTAAHGMMDCGATCSAGPERSIQNLVTAILAKDNSARVTVNGKNRPRFRYGSGKWEKALFQLQVPSSVTGRTFNAFALPNPEEVKEEWFQDHMLVPVLVGMDFLRGNGMIVDFSDGLSVCTAHEGAQPFHLPMNHKEHYMIDIAEFLVDGKENLQGHPEINIIFSEEFQEAAEQQQFLQMFPLTFDLATLPVQSTKSERQLEFFTSFWKRHQSVSSLQHTRLMGNLSTSASARPSTSPTAVDGSEVVEGRRGETMGLGTSCPNGPSRSEESDKSMAMHGKSQPHEVAQQQMGSVAPLRNLCTTTGLCAQPGLSSELNKSAQSGHRGTSFGGAQEPDGTFASNRKHGARDDREGHCGAPPLCHDGPAQDGNGEGNGKGQHGQADVPKGALKGKQGVFEARGLRRASSRKSVVFSGLGKDDPADRAQGAGSDQLLDRGGEDGVAQPGSPTRQCYQQPRGRCGVGAGLQQPAVDDDDPAPSKSLPLRIGQSAVNLIQHVQEGLRGALATLVYGNEPCVWEMFCSPDSGLTNSCLREGLNSIRIGLSSGFDLYKKETYEVLKKVFKQQRPRKIWISPMCTLFCDWTDLNYWYRPEELNKKRRRERQMLRRLVAFLLWVSYMDPTVQLYWEWPRRCRGWKEPIVSDFFERQLQELGHEVWDCRLDGCRYNLKNDDGMFIRKEWTIKTTDLDFYGNFRLKTCTKNHEHAWIQGELTNKTAYYPTNMCRSIARFWSQQLIPQRWFSMLWTAPIEINNAFKLAYANDFADEDAISEGYSPGSLADDKEPPDPQALPDSKDLPGSDEVRDAGGDEEISEKEREVWRTKLNRFHRAAGHPTSKNLARMLQDAGVEKWKVKEALSFKCPYCEEARLGGTSSKQIPPASLRPLPRAWEQVGLDIGEWTVPNFDRKIKFILFIDMATRYKVTESLFDYAHGEVKIENADMVIQAITLRWLMDKPRPHVLIPDNAKSLMSQKFVDFMMEMGVEVIPPPDQESWAHGIVESAINLIKTTATKIHLSMPDMDPRLTLALATSALNSSEFHRGYTSLQWAFGKQTEFGDEELRRQLCLPIDHQQQEFARLLNSRQTAEACARKAKAQVVYSKLKNTSIRQPVRTFHPAQPVMVWRKYLPANQYKGKRGGKMKVMRPRWIGPGRVVMHELVPGQTEGDRQQVIWVVLGNKMYRASVHSVRPLSEREHEVFEAKGDDSSRWKELKDMIPSRSYIDVTHEEPMEEEREEPVLPKQPNSESIAPPKVRFNGKWPIDERGLPILPFQAPRPEAKQSLPAPMADVVNEYNPSSGVAGAAPEIEETSTDAIPISLPSRRQSTSSSTPLLGAVPPHSGEPGDAGGALPEEPEAKRPRLDDDEDKDDMNLDLNTAIQEIDYGYLMEIELDFSSERQKKSFKRNPQAFLVKKMSSAEVNYKKLSEADKVLFRNAKASEVSSFLKTEAVRRCLSVDEENQAKESQRILRARWVLVWKPIPEEDRAEALEKALQPESVYSADGKRKAKARIVVMGFEHPDLLNPTFNSTAPVQSQLMRNLSLCLVAQKKWVLEGLDLTTAFLQTGKTEESREIWTYGVPELRAALGAEDHEVLRILKNIYGNATAPRGLWEDIDKTLKSMGGIRLLGDSSFWVWVRKNPNPRNEADAFETIGFMGGHVDDFNRAGNMDCPEWLEIRKKIDQAYAWGTVKRQSYRHTGIDLEVCEKGSESWVQLCQDYYAEGIPDLCVPAERLRGDPNNELNTNEISACRAALGALQWAATQTQVQICARVNLLLTELTVLKTIQVAKEIQDLIKEVRSNPITLKLWHLPEVQHWQDAVIVTLADQAHNNRPQGGSTGGLMTFVAGPQHLEGHAGRLNLVAWRTWKLKRKAISTNDGEIQCILEGEDHNFRTRFLWSQLNGCCALPPGDHLQRANYMMQYTKGIIATDSKGGYDAVTKSEGPMLGLSNARSALQAYQLREQLAESFCRLIWISGDWNLSDALTKKARVAREGLIQFFKQNIWKLKFDPTFIQSEKKARQLGKAAVKQMQELQALVPCGHDPTRILC